LRQLLKLELPLLKTPSDFRSFFLGLSLDLPLASKQLVVVLYLLIKLAFDLAGHDFLLSFQGSLFASLLLHLNSSQLVSHLLVPLFLFISFLLAEEFVPKCGVVVDLILFKLDLLISVLFVQFFSEVDFLLLVSLVKVQLQVSDHVAFFDLQFLFGLFESDVVELALIFQTIEDLELAQHGSFDVVSFGQVLVRVLLKKQLKALLLLHELAGEHVS